MTHKEITATTIDSVGLDKSKVHIVDRSTGDIYSCDSLEWYSAHVPEYHDEVRKSWLEIKMKNQVRGWGIKKMKITGLNKVPLSFNRENMSRNIFDSTFVMENYSFFQVDLLPHLDKIV